MKKSLRQFYCVRCAKYCAICGRCDRGNVYCGAVCSMLARVAAVKAAGRRYQQSFKGKFKHALRQRAYIARLRFKNALQSKKVTHQRSLLGLRDAVLQRPVEHAFEAIYGCCHFCGSYIGGWYRSLFYKRRGGVRSASWPCAP